MNVQLLLHESVLLTEPVAPPGNALKAFVRARPRATLMAAASRMRAQTELDQARREFAWSYAGVQASDAAFAELPGALQALCDELREAGQPIDLEVRGVYGNAFLLGVAGWWVSFQWRQQAANCLDGSLLYVTQWDAHPEWPGFMVIDKGNKVRTDRYTFGLAAVKEPRWLSESKPDESYTTTDLAQAVLTQLLERPNTRRR